MAAKLLEPSLKHKTLCFLIEIKAQNKSILFDFGARKDFWNRPPTAKSTIDGHVSRLTVDKGVDETLTDSGFDFKTYW